MKAANKLDLPKVQLTQISIFACVSASLPHFFGGKYWGARGRATPANERSCLSQLKNRFKNNIGCGGEKMRNLAPNRDTAIIILYIYVGWDHAIWRTK